MRGRMPGRPKAWRTGKQPGGRMVRPILGAGAMALAMLAFPARASEIEDRFLIMELMDRYGVAHDYGTPADYADLFTADGEIGLPGGPVLVKGRAALEAQAVRDHERYRTAPAADGSTKFLMRHIVTNRVVELTGADSAKGSSYVITMIDDGPGGARILSFARYHDSYVREGGRWLIARRDIELDFGDQELAAKYGFR